MGDPLINLQDIQSRLSKMSKPPFGIVCSEADRFAILQIVTETRIPHADVPWIRVESHSECTHGRVYIADTPESLRAVLLYLDSL
jgi:hypothetical protein